jgi:hypothetical protein
MPLPAAARAQLLVGPLALRVAPVAGETTWSYVCRIAGRYGMDSAALLPWWTWTGTRPRDEAGPRDDAEVLFNPAGRQLLARLGGLGEHDLARALPAFADEPQPADAASPSRLGEAAGSGSPAGRWKVASAGEHGPTARARRWCPSGSTWLALSMTRSSVSRAVREALFPPTVDGFGQQLDADRRDAVRRSSGT